MFQHSGEGPRRKRLLYPRYLTRHPWIFMLIIIHSVVVWKESILIGSFIDWAVNYLAPVTLWRGALYNDPSNESESEYAVRVDSL